MAKARQQISDASALKGLLARQTPQIILAYVRDNRLSEEIHRVYSEHLTARFGQIEQIQLNGLEIDSGPLHGELCTIPMFASYRLLWVRHADSVLKKVDQNKTVLAYFLRDLPALPETTHVLFQIEDKKLPASLALLEDHALLLEEKELREKDLPAFLRDRARSAGYELEKGAEFLLAEKSAFDPRQAQRALDHLFTYTLQEKNISLRDVKEFCSDLEGDLHFAILDSLAERNTDQAIRQLLQQRLSEAIMILGAWSKLYSDALRYHYLRQSGHGSHDIHSRLGLNMHDYVFQKNEERFRKMFSAYNLRDITDILARLTRLDGQIKETSSSEDQRTLLLMFVASLAKEKA